MLVHQYGGEVTVAKFLSRDWKPSIGLGDKFSCQIKLKFYNIVPQHSVSKQCWSRTDKSKYVYVLYSIVRKILILLLCLKN